MKTIGAFASVVFVFNELVTSFIGKK